MAHIWQKSTERKWKEMDGHTTKFPRTTTPKIPLFRAWPNRQDIQSSIPAMFWAFFGTDTWTNGARACDSLFCFSAFHQVWDCRRQQ